MWWLADLVVLAIQHSQAMRPMHHCSNHWSTAFHSSAFTGVLRDPSWNSASQKLMPIARYDRVRPTRQSLPPIHVLLLECGNQVTFQILVEIWVHPHQPVEEFPVIFLKLSHEVVVVALFLTQQIDRVDPQVSSMPASISLSFLLLKLIQFNLQDLPSQIQ